MADKAGPQSVRWALFSLKGRIRRATYGLGMALIFTLWWFAVSQLVSFREDSSQFTLWALILAALAIVSTYCIYALCHKRIHDLGYPGAYALVIVGFSTFLWAFLAIPLLLLGFLPGQREVNPYGPPPVS